jgi:hypothetical protein
MCIYKLSGHVNVMCGWFVEVCEGFMKRITCKYCDGFIFEVSCDGIPTTTVWLFDMCEHELSMEGVVVVAVLISETGH